MEVWKNFEQNIVTHSAAHHLMTISFLLEEKGYARVTDVARNLGITRGSVSITLKALKEKGYVREDENKFLGLTEKGRHLSHSIQSMRKILIKFMKDVLQVEAHQAEIDACKIEHLVSTATGEKLLTFLRYLLSEDTEAKSFLKSYWGSEDFCQGATEECSICETECLMDTDGVEKRQTKTT
ncbi:MAG: metal-dependent transcriptional regulator [bacterium]